MWRIFPQLDDDIAYTMDDEQTELLKKALKSRSERFKIGMEIYSTLCCLVLNMLPISASG